MAPTSGGWCDIGDHVVAVRDLGRWRHRVARGTHGVVITHTIDGRLTVAFTTGSTLTLARIRSSASNFSSQNPPWRHAARRPPGRG